VRCNALGTPSETLEVITEAIPKELEWGEARAPLPLLLLRVACAQRPAAQRVLSHVCVRVL
jgi:hypothetical protein